ncbi:unknown [Candidatus Apopatosoma intestinale]|nr:unknown [Candidatus Apopatosoma intestinale]
MINAILIDRLSVFIRPYKERPNRKCIFFPTGKRIAHIAHLHLRHIIRPLFACYGMMVVVNNNYSIASAHQSKLALAVFVVVTIQNVVS